MKLRSLLFVPGDSDQKFARACLSSADVLILDLEDAVAPGMKDVARELVRRWDLGKPRSKYKGELWEGRTGPGGARVAILLPMTFMNAVGDSAGPARGALKAPLERTLVLHDEIDIPFGEIRTREGGGLAGHNGLKSLKKGFGSPDFWRVRIGVGRPDSTDPEIVSSWVLGSFRESREEVEALP